MPKATDPIRALARRIQSMKTLAKNEGASGGERQVSRTLLEKMEQKLREMMNAAGITSIPATEEETITAEQEQQYVERLGVIYWVFGPEYEEIVGHNRYRVEFLEAIPAESYEDRLVMRIKVNVYQNGKKITDQAHIEFWKCGRDVATVNDVALSYNGREMYRTCHWLEPIECHLAEQWNQYFGTISRQEAIEEGIFGKRAQCLLETNGGGSNGMA